PSRSFHEDLVSPSGDAQDVLTPEQGDGAGRWSREMEQGATPPASTARKSRGDPKRGTRIPDDFHGTPEMVDWARQTVPEVDATAVNPFGLPTPDRPAIGGAAS